jgi:allophanate hydrolase subunit 2
MKRVTGIVLVALMSVTTVSAQRPQTNAPPTPTPATVIPDSPKLGDYKKDATRGVDEMAKLAQEMVDSVFSFGELGFQEVETSKYLTGSSRNTASRWSVASRASRPRGWRNGVPASR